MENTVAAGILHQHWMHSHEEDTDTEMVFRPATFNFPRSRGRAGFQLKPDGTMVELGIAPTDQRQQTSGNWKLEAGSTLVISMPSAPESTRTMQILSADTNRLVVKK